MPIKNQLLRKVKRLYHGYKAIREAGRISRHFSSHFTPVLAKDDQQLAGAHKIRHEVFCEELKLFDEQPEGVEKDAYDEYSKQCLIRHQRTSQYAGTVRMIMPSSAQQTLPIETVASQYITLKEYLPGNFDRNEICEISRIAIPSSFRRRQMDSYEGAATGVINTETYSDIELRCFPLLAVGLYMATAAVCLLEGKKHAFFMVEPRLAKSMAYIGIKLVKIGDEFNYVGRRAPYYINNKDFIRHLSPAFNTMMKSFQETLASGNQVKNIIHD